MFRFGSTSEIALSAVPGVFRSRSSHAWISGLGGGGSSGRPEVLRRASRCFSMESVKSTGVASGHRNRIGCTWQSFEHWWGPPVYQGVVRIASDTHPATTWSSGGSWGGNLRIKIDCPTCPTGFPIVLCLRSQPRCPLLSLPLFIPDPVSRKEVGQVGQSKRSSRSDGCPTSAEQVGHR